MLYKYGDRMRRCNMERRPLIGISGAQNDEKSRLLLGKRYAQEVMRAGGLPVLLPYPADEATIDALLSRMDGLLLAGGGDIHPKYFGEEIMPCCGSIDDERDEFELMLMQKALKLRMPVFGICRGIQVIAVALGATLFQDIETQLGIPKEKHRQTQPFDDPVHTVRFKEGGLFERITGTTLMPTNSMHHQAIKEAGERLKIEGITMMESLKRSAQQTMKLYLALSFILNILQITVILLLGCLRILSTRPNNMALNK